MIQQCANPKCRKTLRYLRDGCIYRFEISDPNGPVVNGRSVYRMEHYWLCGDCAPSLRLERAGSEGAVQLTPRVSAGTAEGMARV